jgi:hypothetical protein
MASFQHPDFDERLSAAASARQALLDRFRAKVNGGDPDLLKKQAERLEIAKAREARLAARKAAKEAQEAAERTAREAREAAEKVEREEREARERVEAAAWKAALEEEKKAERDARYAARKARKLERLNSPFGKYGRR